MDNKIANSIRITGILIIIFGIIGSFILGNVFPVQEIAGVYYQHIEESYNWGIAIVSSICSLITGILFIGFAEVIYLLQQNLNNSEKITNIINILQQGSNNDLPPL